jgi:hypothetical protein
MQDGEDIEAPGDEPIGTETPRNAAQYIASLADEMARIAKRNRLETLCYLLEMARQEADQIAKS